MAVSNEVSSKYMPTIGIETHVQLKSKTKLFAAVGNDAREAPPNTLISHICVALPGALPVLNEGALKLAARAAYALGTSPQKNSHFDRKHYFYPDLPKGYQITQYSDPIIADGKVEIEVDGQKKTINITRAHLEEDAGKNIHPEGADYTLIDLNRAGTPLLEIVSEPEINSPAEAKAFAHELYLLMKYADVSDVDLYHGNMRFDVNISVSQDDKKGIRTEVKNLNSFRSVEGAVAYEIDRQIEALEKGEEIIQETRGWDEAKQKTTSQRGKEEAHDYRYFPDPDIPPVELSDQFLETIKQDMPDLPSQFRAKLKELDIDSGVIEDLLERPDSLKKILKIYESSNAAVARRSAFFLIATPENEWTPSEESLIKLSQMVDSGSLSSSAARKVYQDMGAGDEEPEELAKVLDLLQVSDQAEIEKIVLKVIAANSNVVADIKAGETKAIGFLVGQVMTASKGQANPQLAQEIIKKQLGL
jgi:aspartyl-tRNA(Asn)/glutamyl-tRNA(Gln) amidotransferase subunit B